MNESTQETLERLIDQSSLSAVLDNLSVVCGLKAAHIQENWQDKHLAQAWIKAAVQVDHLSCHAAVKTVS